MTKKSLSCSDCIHSHITYNNYLQCKLTGNCYIPIVMKDRISEDCPLYKDIRKNFENIIDSEIKRIVDEYVKMGTTYKLWSDGGYSIS